MAGQLRLRHRRRGHDALRTGRSTGSSASSSTAAIRRRSQYVDEYELLPAEFQDRAGRDRCRRAATRTTTLSASYTLANQRRVAGRLSFASGAFYDGTRNEAVLLGPRRARAAIRHRAQRLARLGRSAVRRFLRAALTGPLHVHADDAAPRQQPGPVQRGRAHAARPASGSAGSTGPAAISSSSTAMDATTGPANRLLNRSLAVKATRLVRF